VTPLELKNKHLFKSIWKPNTEILRT